MFTQLNPAKLFEMGAHSKLESAQARHAVRVQNKKARLDGMRDLYLTYEGMGWRPETHIAMRNLGERIEIVEQQLKQMTA